MSSLSIRITGETMSAEVVDPSIIVSQQASACGNDKANWYRITFAWVLEDAEDVYFVAQLCSLIGAHSGGIRVNQGDCGYSITDYHAGLNVIEIKDESLMKEIVNFFERHNRECEVKGISI